MATINKKFGENTLRKSSLARKNWNFVLQILK